MKEIHAYKNKDGTYRIKGIGEYHDGYKLQDVVINVERAQIDMTFFATQGSDEICTITLGEEKQC